MLYKKRVSVGAFLEKGKDYKDGDLIELLTEGKTVEGQFGPQEVFSAKTSENKEGNVSFNSTSINNMIDAYGEDSKNWVGKRLKVWGILSNVKGKMTKVYYFSDPEAILNEEGVFSISGKDSATKDIPVIEEDEDPTPPPPEDN